MRVQTFHFPFSFIFTENCLKKYKPKCQLSLAHIKRGRVDIVLNINIWPTLHNLVPMAFPLLKTKALGTGLHVAYTKLQERNTVLKS